MIGKFFQSLFREFGGVFIVARKGITFNKQLYNPELARIQFQRAFQVDSTFVTHDAALDDRARLRKGYLCVTQVKLATGTGRGARQRPRYGRNRGQCEDVALTATIGYDLGG